MKYALTILIALSAIWLFGCSANTTQLVTFDPPVPLQGVDRIAVDDVIAEIAKGKEVIFLDTRKDKVWHQAKTKIPGAIRVSDNEDLKELVRRLPKDQFIVTYCT